MIQNKQTQKIELKALNDSKKSFYKKTYTITNNSTITLLSYDTSVATIKEGIAHISNVKKTLNTNDIKTY